MRGIFQIGARRERAFAGENDGLGFEIVGEASRGLGQFEDELARQRVAPVAAIDRDGRDGALARDGDVLADPGFASWATSSRRLQIVDRRQQRRARQERRQAGRAACSGRP